MKKKLFWQSKTLWFNFLSAVVFLVQDLSGAKFIDERTAVLILIFVNFILRLITKKPLRI